MINLFYRAKKGLFREPGFTQKKQFFGRHFGFFGLKSKKKVINQFLVAGPGQKNVANLFQAVFFGYRK